VAEQDAEADLTQDDRVDRELGLIVSKPIDDALVREGLVASQRTFASTK
jgi:hypothetical protein